MEDIASTAYLRLVLLTRPQLLTFHLSRRTKIVAAVVLDGLSELPVG